jgi:hypothetical protein
MTEPVPVRIEVTKVPTETIILRYYESPAGTLTPRLDR